MDTGNVGERFMSLAGLKHISYTAMTRPSTFYLLPLLGYLMYAVVRGQQSELGENLFKSLANVFVMVGICFLLLR